MTVAAAGSRTPPPVPHSRPAATVPASVLAPGPRAALVAPTPVPPTRCRPHNKNPRPLTPPARRRRLGPPTVGSSKPRQQGRSSRAPPPSPLCPPLAGRPTRGVRRARARASDRDAGTSSPARGEGAGRGEEWEEQRASKGRSAACDARAAREPPPPPLPPLAATSPPRRAAAPPPVTKPVAEGRAARPSLWSVPLERNRGRVGVSVPPSGTARSATTAPARGGRPTTPCMGGRPPSTPRPRRAPASSTPLLPFFFRLHSRVRVSGRPQTGTTAPAAPATVSWRRRH